MFLGLGIPEWLTVLALIVGLWLTFKVMARASVAYENKRLARERAEQEQGHEQREEVG